MNSDSELSSPQRRSSRTAYGTYPTKILHGARFEHQRYNSDDKSEKSGLLSAPAENLGGGLIVHNKEQLSRYIDHSAFGVALDIFLSLVSMTFVGTYIYNTYLPVNMLPFYLWCTEIICAGILTIDFLCNRLYLAQHRIDYIFSLHGMFTLIVIIPVIPVSFMVQFHTLWYGKTYLRFVYPARVVRCYFDLKAVLFRSHAYLTPVRQLALLCYLQIVLILTTASGIIQIAETSALSFNEGSVLASQWSFFASFFNSVLIFVTLQAPPAENDLTKFFIGILVLVLAIVIPYQISRVLDLNFSFSEYQVQKFKSSKSQKHIVLCGDLTPARIDHFFNEVFHDDHDTIGIQVVIMNESEPPTSMVTLLMDPFFQKRITYIQGSILDVDDCKRASIAQADAIFILTRRGTMTDAISSSDNCTLMRIMAVKQFSPTARIFAQLHLSSSRTLLENMAMSGVIIFSEVIPSLLGQNCVCPGFSTLIYNLTYTSNDDGDGPSTNTNTLTGAVQDSNLGYDGQLPPIQLTANGSTSMMDKNESGDRLLWINGYKHGSSHELYSVTLPPSSIVGGKTFAEVASYIYLNCFGVIVLGVYSNSAKGQVNSMCIDLDGSSTSSFGGILLNPGHAYICTGNDAVIVIAKNKRDAELVSALNTPMVADYRALTPHPNPNDDVVLNWNNEDTLPSLLPPSNIHSHEQRSGSSLAIVSENDDNLMYANCRNYSVDEENMSGVSSFAGRSSTRSTPATSPLAAGRRHRRKSRLVDWERSNHALEVKKRMELADILIDNMNGENGQPIMANHQNVNPFDGPTTKCIIANKTAGKNEANSPIVVFVISPTHFPKQMEYFIGPLRWKALRYHRPIVIVTQALPDKEALFRLYAFKDVYLLQGDPFSISTFKRAAVERAFKVVILIGQSRAAESTTAERLSDAGGIALHKAITTYIGNLQAPRVITELINVTNVHFLSQNLQPSAWFPGSPQSAKNLSNELQESSSEYARKFFVSPAFASGLTYSTSLCDSLLINQYFNPRMEAILHEFIFASWKERDRITIASDKNNGMPNGESKTIQRSSLFAVEIPSDFVGKTFAYVFHYLLSSDGILAIGLYRCRPTPNDGSSTDPPNMHANRIDLAEDDRSVPFGYVYVNPFPRDVLTGNDLLYVLHRKQPMWS